MMTKDEILEMIKDKKAKKQFGWQDEIRGLIRDLEKINKQQEDEL